MNKLISLLKPLSHPAIRPILLGVLGFIFINLVFTLGVTISPLNPKFNFSYGNFLPAKLNMLKQQTDRQPEVLFLGTSQTNNGFIPQVFEQASGKNIRSFNLGLPNNRYDIMLAYLQFHQHRYGRPKLVLIELSPSIQEKDASLYFLPALYYRTLIEQDPTLTATYLKNPLLADNVKQELLFSGFSSLRQYRFTFSPVNVVRKVSEKLQAHLPGLSPGAPPATVADAGENSPGVTDSISPAIDPSWMEQGWYPKPQSPHMTNPAGIVLSVAEARKYYIDQQPAVYFDKLQALLHYCQQENIPVALVSWPNHPAFIQAFQSSPLNASYQQGLQRLLAQTAVPLINLNQDIPPTQRITEGGLFADPRHLTPTGAHYFSRKLAERLLNISAIAALLKPTPSLCQRMLPTDARQPLNCPRPGVQPVE
jgi:hypothetical protein